MASVKRRYSKEEFASRGDAVYEKRVRPQLKAEDEGKFAAIDIDVRSLSASVTVIARTSKLVWNGEPLPARTYAFFSTAAAHSDAIVVTACSASSRLGVTDSSS